ncbi:sigma-70 family RNA polymerase sigma factor [Bradyrhizobium sp. CSA112]|uniref:RNA polymerase sigma factor n=1 Tax=Bradyrhizobium sp. CSA112 TaxID=2699170 RepID=UPI0023B0ECE1|nr:sigma-70 family RNA polymerase sigma factor [Bradyrhizobium sp. CSA112]MDE5456004.1 sigma-70 family RNA polymerase sigma factor [Bradyrhizobium sp. CSA112]
MALAQDKELVSTTVSPTASERAVRAALVDGYDRLRNYLQKHFSAPTEAEEVLQAFVLRALERSATIRDADSVRGWLSRVLATTIADFHRQTSKKRAREVAFAVELYDRLAANQGSELDGAACECIYAHLPLLKAEHAEAIRRIDLGGEPRETVAAELGLTVNNLTVRLHRARQALKERLEGACTDCVEESFFDCRCGDLR